MIKRFIVSICICIFEMFLFLTIFVFDIPDLVKGVLLTLFLISTIASVLINLCLEELE